MLCPKGWTEVCLCVCNGNSTLHKRWAGGVGGGGGSVVGQLGAVTACMPCRDEQKTPYITPEIATRKLFLHDVRRASLESRLLYIPAHTHGQIARRWAFGDAAAAANRVPKM